MDIHNPKELAEPSNIKDDLDDILQLKEEIIVLKDRIGELENRLADAIEEKEENEYLYEKSICTIKFKNIHPEVKQDIDEFFERLGKKLKEEKYRDDTCYVWDGLTQYYRGFSIDTSRYPYATDDDRIKFWEIPYYQRITDNPLPHTPGQIRPMKRLQRCFNCGDVYHEISKCPYPLDRETVRKNKLSFRQKTRQQPAHGEVDSRYFGHMFKQGTLSPRLREALGIEEGEDPPYLERMKIHGPPPGYQKKEFKLKQPRKIRKLEDYIKVEDEEIEEVREPLKKEGTILFGNHVPYESMQRDMSPSKPMPDPSNLHEEGYDPNQPRIQFMTGYPGGHVQNYYPQQPYNPYNTYNPYYR